MDPYALDGDARVDLIRAWERVAAMVAAGQQRALAAVAEATEGLGRPGEEARHEVGAALRLCPGTAAGLLEVARELVHRLPAVQAALAAGVIGYLQAARSRPGCGTCPTSWRSRSRTGCWGPRRARPWRRPRRAVARAVQTVDPASAADRHTKATANRTIEQMPQPDGMESTWLTMPASVSKDLWETLTADAKAAQADRKLAGLPFVGLDALRVDALVHAVLGNGGADPNDPTMTTVTTSDGDGEPDEGWRHRGAHDRPDRHVVAAAAAGAAVPVRRRADGGGGDRPADPARPHRPAGGDPRLRPDPGRRRRG